VPTVAFRTLYVLFFITHDRRELVPCRVTAHPTAAWILRQLLQGTAWRRQPAYVLRGRDAGYGRGVATTAHATGIETLLAPYRAPRANAVAERVVRTLRQECLDHVLVLGERHLEAVLTEDVRFYNSDRPHRSLGLTPPLPTARAPCAPVGPVVA